MLFYIVESATPLLTILLLWAAWEVLKKKNVQKHRKVALVHAGATVASLVLVVLLVRLGYQMGEKAPEWILSLHLKIIYFGVALLVMVAATGLKRKKRIHFPLAIVYVLNWAAALVTGAMIFGMHKGWM